MQSPTTKIKLIHTIIYIFIIACIIDNIECSNSLNITLGSQHMAIFTFNFSKVDDANLNQIFIIHIPKTNYILMNKKLSEIKNSSENGLKRLQIFNYQAQTYNVQISIKNFANKSNSLNIQQILIQNLIKQPNFNQGILMKKIDIQNYILPFNLIDQKFSKIILEQSNFTNNKVIYDYQPYLDTFWNQHNSDYILLSWLPYFSRCQYKTNKRIFLEDVINPWESFNFQINKIGRICNSSQSWFWGTTLQCTGKNIKTQCFLEELNVKNKDKQPWWMNTQKNLFYFISNNKFDGSLLAIDKYSVLTQLSQQYYTSLIPLVYYQDFDLKSETPNKFVLHLTIASIYDLEKLQIVSAKLTASKINQNQAEDQVKYDSQIILELQIQYLNNFQTLLAYGKSTELYIIIYVIFMIVILGFVKIFLMSANINLHFYKITKLIIFPIGKGFFMAFLLSSMFVIFFYLILANTYFSGIAYTFDSSDTSNQWNSYTGRVGLTMFCLGYFLLSTGISQAFKIPTPQQTKIILQDHMIQKNCPNQSLDSQQVQNEQDKQNFIIKNMNSQRKYIFTYMMAFSLYILLLYYYQLNFTLAEKFCYVIIVYPIFHKIIIIIYRHFAVKQLLYLNSILTTYQVFNDVLILNDLLLWEAFIFYFVKLIATNLLSTFLQILFQIVTIKAYDYLTTQPQYRKPYCIVQYFRKQIFSVLTEPKYQKSMFYSNLLSIRFAAILTRPFLCLTILLTIKYNYICNDISQDYYVLLKNLLMIIFFMPIDILVSILTIKFFETKFNLEILKCLEFNQFKFKKRKVKWVNDSFVQNKSVQYFYKQFQKFCFSSQMYLLVFLSSFALLTIMVGMKIILEVGYISFIDPGMLIILIIIWVTGNLFSILLNFISIKLKLYQRKQDGKMRGKLENIQKILKKSDYSQFLETEAVKSYFLFHCKEWIIKNITKIFVKQDFIQNNYQFLMNYQHYKSELQKKRIEQRKKQEKTNAQKHSNSLKVDQQHKKIIVKLPKKQFQQLVKPLVLSWLYIAKQFTFLKSLIVDLKQTKKKQTCQFCSMNIQLQVLEKVQFENIVNSYRILNVGRMFSQKHFRQFYQFKQQYITVCIQCKDKKLYIQKKHLDLNGYPKKLIKKWLIIARSKLLHRKKQKITGQ